jgi:hypothetical protein
MMPVNHSLEFSTIRVCFPEEHQAGQLTTVYQDAIVYVYEE